MLLRRLLALTVAFTAAGPLAAAPKELPDKKPQVEVVFCLDTTGSMGGLIEGAKQKIWSISNQIVAGKPTPSLKVGLLAYRDRKDAYVTKMEPLTDDLDKIYSTLKEFKAEGGGDTPESVNQALHESVTRFKWSDDKGTLKIIFLVGDAPPHMDYEDDIKFPETCKLASEKGILINTIQCGAAADTTKVWQEISDRASGSYVKIAQDGAQVRVVTPFDKRLGEINAELENSTLVYGNKEKQERDRRFQAGAVDGAKAETTKDAKGEAKTTVVVTAPKAPEAKAGTILPAAPAAAGAAPGAGFGGGGAGFVAADRGAYNAMRGIINSYDLISDLKAGKVKLESIKEEDLPEELKKLPKEKRQAYLDEIEKKREKLREEARDLAKKRDEFARKKLEEDGKKDGFDRKVEEMLQKQAKKVGIDY